MTKPSTTEKEDLTLTADNNSMPELCVALLKAGYKVQMSYTVAQVFGYWIINATK